MATLTTNRSWGMKGLSAALAEKTWGTGGWQAGHEPAMCPHSTKSQPYPGLHRKKYGQQVEGGDPAPLVWQPPPQLDVISKLVKGALNPTVRVTDEDIKEYRSQH